jgi:hypothetical protein
MNIEQLRDYTKWLEKSPGVILAEISHCGGWKSIFDSNLFPNGLPRWAHRVRNFFNQEPNSLALIEGSIHIYHNIVNWDTSRGLKDNMALSGDVYYDEFYKKWLQMSSGGAVYHFSHGLNPTEAALIYGKGGQSSTPVFKLISPDGSGGSCETIINNPPMMTFILGFFTASRQSTIGDGEYIPVTSRIKTISDYYRGSYNYAETSVAGFEFHEKFDIKPHELKPKDYINPPDRFSNIFFRKFPEFALNETTPLADQKW